MKWGWMQFAGIPLPFQNGNRCWLMLATTCTGSVFGRLNFSPGEMMRTNTKDEGICLYAKSCCGHRLSFSQHLEENDQAPDELLSTSFKHRVSVWRSADGTTRTLRFPIGNSSEIPLSDDCDSSLREDWDCPKKFQGVGTFPNTERQSF